MFMNIGPLAVILASLDGRGGLGGPFYGTNSGGEHYLTMFLDFMEKVYKSHNDRILSQVNGTFGTKNVKALDSEEVVKIISGNTSNVSPQNASVLNSQENNSTLNQEPQNSLESQNFSLNISPEDVPSSADSLSYQTVFMIIAGATTLAAGTVFAYKSYFRANPARAEET